MLALIDSPLGLEFINWLLKLVIHCFRMYFPEFGPKRSKIELRMLSLSLEGKSGNSKFGFFARAKDSSLERPTFTLSHARAKDWWLERKIRASSTFTVSSDRSSEGLFARAKPLILEARSSEALIFSNF